MPTVAVNPPKTPVTKGSHGLAIATVPNVCKMPGPPAPFVPTPLPNIGRSELSPQGYSTTVKVEGEYVAIKGATFKSIGDIASQGTGGGIVSSTTQGTTAFVAPGSMDVKIEGNNVQLLGDAMTNNGGSPANAATATETQAPGVPVPPFESKIDCEENKKPRGQGKGKGWDDCDVKQLCAKVKESNKLRKDNKLVKTPGASNDPLYNSTKADYVGVFGTASSAGTAMSEAWLDKQFYDPCAKEKWEKAGRPANPTQKPADGSAEMFNPDHVHDAGLGGNLSAITNFKMLSSSVNKSVGGSFAAYNPPTDGPIELVNCDCP